MTRCSTACTTGAAKHTNAKRFLASLLLISQSLSPLYATQGWDVGEQETHKCALSPGVHDPLEDMKREGILTREFPLDKKQKILLAYAEDKQEVSGFVVDARWGVLPVKKEDMPSELHQIKTAATFKAFCEHVYVQPRFLGHDDVSFFVHQRGFGGEKGELHDAIKNGNKEKIKTLLNEDVDVNEEDKNGQTPLHWAAIYGCAEVALLLLEHKANVNATDTPNAMTALHWAALNNRPLICQILLDRGADIRVQNRQNLTAQALAERNGYEEVGKILKSHTPLETFPVVHPSTKLHSPSTSSSSSSSSSSSKHINSPSQQTFRYLPHFQQPQMQPLSLMACPLLRVFPDTPNDSFCSELPNYAHVEHLNLIGCTQLPEASIRLIAKTLTKLQKLDLTDCVQVTELTAEFLATRLKFSLKELNLTGIPGISGDMFLKLQETGLIIHPEAGAEKILDCSNEEIDDGELVAKLRNYPNIQTLNLNGCRFITEVGIKHLSTLKNLRILHIIGCANITQPAVNIVISKHPLILPFNFHNQAFGADFQLKTILDENPYINALNLGGCDELTNEGLAHIARLSSLTSLSLFKSEPKDEDNLIYEESFCLMKKSLRSFRFLWGSADNYNAWFTDEGLAPIARLSALKKLNLWNCNKITDKGLVQVTKLSSLTLLDLGRCNQLTNKGLAQVSKLKSLTSLNLYHCNKLTDEGLAHIARLSSLKELNLWNCDKITDKGLAQIGKLSSLMLLDLEGCQQITDGGVVQIAKLSSLASLDIGGCNQITDKGLAPIGTLQHLDSLYLPYCNKLTDEGLKHLTKLQRLTEVDLTGCDQITMAGLIILKLLSNNDQLEFVGYEYECPCCLL